MGTQNGHNVPFLKSGSLRERKRKAIKRIKQIYKSSENGNKKISCHLVPKVVIDLPFEGRKVEGSRTYRRSECVPKTGSRRQEIITAFYPTNTGLTLHAWLCECHGLV